MQTGLIDYDKLEEKAMDFRPKLIICGGSAYPREWDYKRFREIAGGCLAWAGLSWPWLASCRGAGAAGGAHAAPKGVVWTLGQPERLLERLAQGSPGLTSALNLSEEEVDNQRVLGGNDDVRVPGC